MRSKSCVKEERKSKKRIRKATDTDDKSSVNIGHCFELENEFYEKEHGNGKKSASPDRNSMKICGKKKTTKLKQENIDVDQPLKIMEENIETEIGTPTEAPLSKNVPKVNITTKLMYYDLKTVGGRIVSFTAKEYLKPPPGFQTVENNPSEKNDDGSDVNTDGITLLLFYQYIEPVLDRKGLQSLLSHVSRTGAKYSITGRMRTSIEGLNCTLTGEYTGFRRWCKELREFGNDTKYFSETEFKLTDNLPKGQAFPKLHAFEVKEIVNYGLSGNKAPSIKKTGIHLEIKEYHSKMMELLYKDPNIANSLSTSFGTSTTLTL